MKHKRDIAVKHIEKDTDLSLLVKTIVDKNDKETLYALRRLAKWMGDVYVREPSGSGYWANVTVSFKIEGPFYLFVVNPKNVGCNNINATLFHLLEVFFPLFPWNSAVMHFTHNRKPRFSVFRNHPVCNLNGLVSKSV